MSSDRDAPAATNHSDASSADPDYVEQRLADDTDNVVPTRGYHSLPTVGLGGSAGAIPALQRFFENAPVDSGAAFIVVLHLSPTHDSALPLLLGRWTTMPVVAACDREPLQPNHVYVIPPAKHLIMTDGHVELRDLAPEHGQRVAVDLFFRSLADSHGPHATAVVLSGADGDGALGIKRIKERGGLTIAQEPADAEQDSMPRAAIATTMVDWILPAAEMPERIAAYIARATRLRLPSEEKRPAGPPAAIPGDEAESALAEILTFLRARTGRDFSYYKRATILRRIARRMQVNALYDLRAYLMFLRTHAGEAGALLQDLLISVTNFFRDRDAFEAFEGLVPEWLGGKGTGDSFRVWVPACATGEEAYSIGMLLLEHARTLETAPAIQIFGCDLDEGAINFARAGLYPDAIVADVSKERLRRFFTKEPRGYRVRRELRELTLFAQHDLLKDPAFSRMDLVSCRNLLIYLNREAQKRAVDLFHFALRPHGMLMLGAPETIDDESILFAPVDKKQRLYRQVPVARTAMPIPIATTLASTPREHEREGSRHAVLPAAWLFDRRVAEGPQAGSGNEALTPSELHVRLLERLASPSLVVSADNEVVHLSASAGQFLTMAGGEPTRNVLQLVHPDIRAELRAALFHATETSSTAEVANVPVERNGARSAVTLRVAPARELAPGFMLVTFEESEPLSMDADLRRASPQQEQLVARLERELDTMKARFRQNVEQYEANVEELKANNEELQAMNEELRSMAEELQTSREELQSINEELGTVNVELKTKLDELAHANSDLHNLMASTAIATIFLDRELRITRYTPSALELFRIIPSDVGRPLNDLRHQLDYPTLTADAERVLERLVPIEQEVGAGGAGFYLVRILPYRTAEDRIAGVVLTFVDITRNRRAEEALRRSEELLRLVVENARDYAIFSLDLERRITSWNAGAVAILGWAQPEAVGQSGDIIFTTEDRVDGAPQSEAERAVSDGRAMNKRWHVRKDGSRFWGSGVMMSMYDEGGAAIGLVKVFRDETDELRAKEALERSREELVVALRETDGARAEAEAAGRAKDLFLAVLSHELRTPLTPVLIGTRALSRRKDLATDVLDALAMIERNVRLEARLIDDLLDITRISHGKLEVVREPVDIHEVVRRAVDVSRSDLDGKAQRLNTKFDATITSGVGDSARLQQVFWNVLKNAAKFTPRDGMITLATRNTPGRIVIAISDEGIGFDADVADRIFVAFEQANETVTRELGGLGLGLAIAKAAVEAHGGTITAESAGSGKGATFTVELPLDEA